MKSNTPTLVGKPGMFGISTFGKFKLTPLSKLLSTPVPPAASFNDSAAFATLNNEPDNSCKDLTAILLGPFPIVH